MKKYKVLIILILILFSFTAIINSVISADVHHLEICHVDHCEKCTLIQHAINFVNNLVYLISYIVLLSVILPLIQIIREIIIKRGSHTLVECKVRLNE